MPNSTAVPSDCRISAPARHVSQEREVELGQAGERLRRQIIEERLARGEDIVVEGHAYFRCEEPSQTGQYAAQHHYARRNDENRHEQAKGPACFTRHSLDASREGSDRNLGRTRRARALRRCATPGYRQPESGGSYDRRRSRRPDRQNGRRPPPRNHALGANDAGQPRCPFRSCRRCFSSWRAWRAAIQSQLCARRGNPPRTGATTDRGSIALIEAGHHCVKTLSICAICLPAAYWSPRCRLEAWPLLQDDVAVPVDAMELEYTSRCPRRESLSLFFALLPNASSFGSWTMRDGGIADRRLPAGGKGRYLYVGLETKP